MTRLLTLVAALALASSPVVAADARALYQAGSDALAAGKSAEAVKNFEAAYAEQPSPSLLYWIGEAHFAAGNLTKAADFYRRYLDAAPKGDKVAQAKARLAELKKREPPARKKRARRMRAAELDLAKAPPAADLPLPGPTPPPDLPLPGATPAPQQLSDLPLPGQAPAAPQAAAPAPPAAPETAPPTAPATAPVEPVAEAPPAATAQPSPPPVQPRVAAALPDVIGTDSGDFLFFSYTARLLAPSGSRMLSYATTASPGDGTLYTHGFALGRQTEHFKHALYLGFGTEFGGGTDTLGRYELSYQLLYTPFGFDPIGRTARASTKLISPHIGFRIGGMGVDSQKLTGGSLKPGLLLAAQAGFDLQVLRWLVLSPGMGYDLNLGPDLGPNASVSGYSFDLSATLRY